MRLATFNILSGRSLADGRVDEARFAAAIGALEADVLALQEVDRDQDRSGRLDLAAVAARAMGATTYRFAPALVGTPGSAWTTAAAADGRQAGERREPAYGVALLSRLPVRDWQVARLPALPGRAPYRWPGSRRPSLVRDEPRVALSAVVATTAGALTVVTTHLSFLPGWNVHQLRRAVRLLAPRDGPRVLLGDLNMGARAAGRVTGMRSAVAAATFPVAEPARQLDHVLVADLPPGLHPVGGAARDLGVSDHRALVVDLG